MTKKKYIKWNKKSAYLCDKSINPFTAFDRWYIDISSSYLFLILVCEWSILKLMDERFTALMLHCYPSIPTPTKLKAGEVLCQQSYPYNIHTLYNTYTHSITTRTILSTTITKYHYKKMNRNIFFFAFVTLFRF